VPDVLPPPGSGLGNIIVLLIILEETET
jgi:hypothetical protein